MRNRHCLCKTRDFIHARPQCLQNVAFNLTSALHEIECKLRKAFSNVGGEMPLSDGTGNFQGIPQLQEFQLWHSLLEMNDPLATYVVNNQRLYMPWKSLQGLADRVVHIGLLILRSITWSFTWCRILYRSPFWKSTTQCGTNAPCLAHAHAPLPVESKCFWWRLPLFCALWLLHLDFLAHVNS